jgi:hypothetical protein
MVSVQLHWVGRSEEALKCFDREMALYPYFPSLPLSFRAQAAYQSGQYPDAVSLLKRRNLRNPETESSRAARRTLTISSAWSQACARWACPNRDGRLRARGDPDRGCRRLQPARRRGRGPHAGAADGAFAAI